MENLLLVLLSIGQQTLPSVKTNTVLREYSYRLGQMPMRFEVQKEAPFRVNEVDLEVRREESQRCLRLKNEAVQRVYLDRRHSRKSSSMIIIINCF